MKLQHLALFALVAAFTAGCSPKNGPSGYGEDNAGSNTGTTTGTGTTGGEVNQDPNGLSGRGDVNSKIADFNGDLSKINPAAIALVVHFGFDKYNVEAGERAKIDAAVASLKGKKIIAAGYTDHFGTEEYNLGLSDKRANSVKNYLGTSGVTDTDIRAFGEQQANQSGDKNAVSEDRKVVIIDTTKL